MAKKKPEGEWPKEIVDLLQWCLDEAVKVAADIEKRYRVKLNHEETAQLTSAIHDQIGAALIRKSKEH